MSTLWGYLFVEGYLLTWLLVPVIFFQKKKNPTSILAWIMIIIMLPYFGSVLFFLFGVNRVYRRVARRQAMLRELETQLPGLPQYEMLPVALNPQAAQLMRLAERISGYKPCYGNDVEVIDDTHRAFGLIVSAILNAKHSIHLEYYIWQPDKLGTKLRDMLIQRAKEGVEVRFLYDGFGSMRLRRQFLKPMQDAGIQTASTIPGASFRERWSFNLRNHRKIVIVDGLLGFAGGMNVGDDYLGRNPRLGFWRDTHLKLRGPVVLQLQQVFAEDWFYATQEEVTKPEYYPVPQSTGDQVAQVVAGGPDLEAEAFHSLFFAAINEARSRIVLSTSFFVPTPSLQQALETAAYRGVKVRLLLAGKVDIFGMLWAGRAFYESLMEAGVEIYEYQGGLLHSKTLTIDGKWSLIGSPNFDARSVQLNFEVAVALDDPKVAALLEDHFSRDIKLAKRVDPVEWAERGFWARLAEHTIRLFSPVL